MWDPILVVDRDDSFLGQIKNESEASPVKTFPVQTRDEALNILKNPNHGLSAVVLDLTFSESFSVDLIRLAHEFRAGIPIVGIFPESGILPLTDENLQLLGFSQVFRKPLQYRSIVKEIIPVADSIQWKDVPGVMDPAPQIESSEFVPIRARNFVSGSKSLFDVFIQLSGKRMVKILHAGEAFDLNRVMKYLQQGMEWFYIPKDRVHAYVVYCEKLERALRASPAVPQTISTEQSLHLGDVVVEYLRDQKMNSGQIEYAHRFSQSLVEVVRRSHWASGLEFQNFLKNLGQHEHGVATAMITTLMLQELFPKTERMRYMIGLVSLLHDVGAHPGGGEEDPEHPRRSADLLRRIPGIEPGLVQAVIQHHERRDGKGFPAGKSSGQIHRIAEVLHVSDQLIHVLEAQAKNGSKTALRELAESLPGRVSTPVVNAFEKLFLKS